MPQDVTLVEVGPRDGLQNETQTIPTPIKIEFINLLSQTGLRHIEATSFVSPKRIPQLADHREVLQGIERHPGIHYPVLIPNERGLNTAITANVKEIAVFTTVSETFCQRNTHCSIDESLTRIAKIMSIAKQQRLKVRGYISCVLGCPYEGHIAPGAVGRLAEQLIELGCDTLSLGDTIGIGTPKQASSLIDHVAQSVPINKLAVHFHDTYGQALANIYACLERGVRIIDSAVAGLGGCPYAPGASGNVATEDVLYMLDGLRIDTGVDMIKLLKASRFITDHLGQPSRAKAGLALQQSMN